MTTFTRSVRLLAALGTASICITAAMAQGTESPGAASENAQPAPTEWPCEQPLRPQMSIGAMWQGPALDEESDWRKVPGVAALVDQIAPRSMPEEEAVENIRRFAAGHDGAERTKVLGDVFLGLFETLSAERNDIVRGIKRFYRRQDALARRIEEGWKKLGEIDPNATDPVTRPVDRCRAESVRLYDAGRPASRSSSELKKKLPNRLFD